MTEQPRTTRTLVTVHPELAAKVRLVFAAMAALGFPMVAYSGRRSVEEQQALYAQGRSRPGRRVTNADGVHARSRHQDGDAVDACFLVDGQFSWAETLPWKAYGACAEALGLEWGGTWGDGPHVQRPQPRAQHLLASEKIGTGRPA